MAKIKAAQERLFKNVFVCRNCSSKMRADPKKILENKVKCRKCGTKFFRQVRKK